MAKPDGGPAFPANDYLVGDLKRDGFQKLGATRGLSLRDYFAGQALAGLLAKGTEGRFSNAAGVNRAAVWAYEYADAMIAARERD